MGPMMITLSVLAATHGRAVFQEPMDSLPPATLPPIAKGPFTGNLDSLKQNRYPKWFTDGKLGIWAHWGPQSVPMEGDWYARQLYQQGSSDYNDHLARYGHPSKSGYRDIIPLWKAEKWDPDRLMAMYRQAGARYFVSMGCHHDNFDLWNSTYHRWNAVKMGPHRDVVGTWQKAAKKLGLHFGVSEHMGASFTWFQVSRGSDATGPMAGVPYDGNDPAYEDLYHFKAEPGDSGWYSTNPRWHAEWFRRIKDLIDQYHPDLLYSDGGIPFGDVGATMVAHLYNSDISLHHGHQEVVYTCKQPSDGRWAQDVERGVMSQIQPFPWQTDTSIGDWFYNKHWKYRGADWVLHTLIDVVSKNGNLLINVVQRPDGSLDPEAEKVLSDMATWMKINGESIYGSKPWVTYGEGPTRERGGSFSEDFPFSDRDVRYVSKGDRVVYATLLGNPADKEVVLRSFARASGGASTAKIQSVGVLGQSKPVLWNWKSDGLHLRLPHANYSDIAVVLKIKGQDLGKYPVPPPVVDPATIVQAAQDGAYVASATISTPHGSGISIETRDGIENLASWENPADWASWSVNFTTSGSYDVTAIVATSDEASKLQVDIQGKHLTADVPVTGDWGKFVEISLGSVDIGASGVQTLAARAADSASWKAINLREIRLRRHVGVLTMGTSGSHSGDRQADQGKVGASTK